MLDLFAGTGALGIEAISRGAGFVQFVDDGAEARALIRENVAALGLGGVTRISAAMRRSSARRIRSSRSRSSSSIRPMAKTCAEQALDSARAGGWLAPDALIVVEEAAKARFAAPEGSPSSSGARYDEREFIFLGFIPG